MTVKRRIKQWVKEQPPGTKFTILSVWEVALQGDHSKSYVARVLKELSQEGQVTRIKNPKQGRGKADSYEAIQNRNPT